MLQYLVKAALLVSVIAATAANASAVDKSIDKRTQTDSDGVKYLVVFCARGGSATGHSFVTWAQEEPHRRQSIIVGSHGFYPANGNGAFGSVPGTIRNESLNPNSSLITDRLIVRVNRAVFLRSQSAILRWKTSDYNLYSRNCINFVMDVATECGLSVPSKGGSLFPSSYIQKLIQSN